MGIDMRTVIQFKHAEPEGCRWLVWGEVHLGRDYDIFGRINGDDALLPPRGMVKTDELTHLTEEFYDGTYGATWLTADEFEAAMAGALWPEFRAALVAMRELEAFAEVRIVCTFC